MIEQTKAIRSTTAYSSDIKLTKELLGNGYFENLNSKINELRKYIEKVTDSSKVKKAVPTMTKELNKLLGSLGKFDEAYSDMKYQEYLNRR